MPKYREIHWFYLIVIPVHKVHETLINDIPPENRFMTKRQLSADENGLTTYVHMRSTPPPEYSTEAVAVVHQLSDDGGKGKAKIKKRVPTAIDIESQQKVNC